MYDQIREDTLYIMLYTVVTTMVIMVSCYLLFRRANAIAPDVTSPRREPPAAPTYKWLENVAANGDSYKAKGIE